MSSANRIAAIVLAAGSGTRSGDDAPKQYRLLAGRPVLAHCVAALVAHERIGDILLVCAPGAAGQACAALGDLAALAAQAEPPSHVLIHDSARPRLPAEVIDRLVAALDAGVAGVIPVLPVVDTLVAADGDVSGDTLDRAVLRRVQTPQAFRFD